MKDTTLRTAEQLGAAIRLKRKERDLSQAALAGLLGVERKWVLKLEAGNPKAELGLVLKALKALDIRMTLTHPGQKGAQRAAPPVSQLDEVFQRLERSRRR